MVDICSALKANMHSGPSRLPGIWTLQAHLCFHFFFRKPAAFHRSSTPSGLLHARTSVDFDNNNRYDDGDLFFQHHYIFAMINFVDSLGEKLRR